MPLSGRQTRNRQALPTIAIAGVCCVRHEGTARLTDSDFDTALAAIPTGYGEGRYAGKRYGVTVKRSGDGRRISLFAEELAGTDKISFNLYRLGPDRSSLKPCEMPAAKVIAFVLGYAI
jgi:hypothetical protein